MEGRMGRKEKGGGKRDGSKRGIGNTAERSG